MNPKFNLDHADTLIGKSILIDLTVRDYDELFIEQKKMFGQIVSVNEDRGIAVRLATSGELYYLVPDLDQIAPAPPGSYRLEPGEEIAVNPDFQTSHVVHLPPPEFEGRVVQEP